VFENNKDPLHITIQ